MSDILDKKPAVPADFVDEGFKLEVVEEVATPEADEATLALQAKIVELEQGNVQYKEALEKITSGNAQDQNTQLLAQEIAKLKAAQPTPTVETPAQIDYSEMMAKIDKDFYTAGPSKSVLEIMTPVVQNMEEKYAGMNNTQTLNIAKLTVLADDSLKGDFIKYKDEVEDTVRKMTALSPPSETVYIEAVKKARANHMDEIIATTVAAQIAELTKTAEQEAKAAAPIAGQVPFTLSTQQTAAAPIVATATKITAADEAKAKHWAMVKGFTWSDAGDQQFVVEHLKKLGEIK